jgi:hypothetical protein
MDYSQPYKLASSDAAVDFLTQTLAAIVRGKTKRWIEVAGVGKITMKEYTSYPPAFDNGKRYRPFFVVAKELAVWLVSGDIGVSTRTDFSALDAVAAEVRAAISAGYTVVHWPYVCTFKIRVLNRLAGEHKTIAFMADAGFLKGIDAAV